MIKLRALLRLSAFLGFEALLSFFFLYRNFLGFFWDLWVRFFCLGGELGVPGSM
jgi:hypothetical protein